MAHLKISPRRIENQAIDGATLNTIGQGISNSLYDLTVAWQVMDGVKVAMPLARNMGVEAGLGLAPQYLDSYGSVFKKVAQLGLC